MAAQLESSLKEHLNQIMDKLEDVLFNDNINLPANQFRHFQSLFSTESYLFSADLLKFFKQEIFVGFAFNVLLFHILFFYLPGNLEMCWMCNKVMTCWLVLLGIMNVALIIPKVFLIRKLLRIEEATDIYMANYALWIFFKARVYQFNIIMSRYIFCAYIVGLFLFVFTNGEVKQCEQFYGLMTFLFGSFALRAIFGFLKFIQNVSASHEIEALATLFNGMSTKEIQSLQVMKIDEYNAKYKKDDEDCPICYMKYGESDEVRVMECKGCHAYHKKCVDEWLVKSKRCPQCRSSVFASRREDRPSKRFE